MKYFEKFSSNSYAGSSNQFFFNMQEDKICTGRVFYKIYAGGRFNYSLLFSNIIDSTYDDGSISHRNLICDEWKIHCAKIGRCKSFGEVEDISKLEFSDGAESGITVYGFKDITFSGQKSKEVMPGEFFSSDPVALEFEKDEYLCLEITFSGKMIPYHEETLLPVFEKTGEVWKYSKRVPLPAMIGCDRKICGKIAYFGDSITQGIGTKPDSYRHWNALLSGKIGEEYAFWNLGIGFGRANDAATDGAWMYKAKQNDIVFVCYGVNDILRGYDEQQIKNDLTEITETLKKAGIKVVVQTVPPFDYQGEDIEKWNRINDYILNELKDKADFVFDNTKCLGDSQNPSVAVYGGHPDEEGCRIWAEALWEKIRESGIL